MKLRIALLVAAGLFLTSCRTHRPADLTADDQSDVAVGPVQQGMIVPTRQLIRPAGDSVEFHGRPVDLVPSPDGKRVYVKSSDALLVLDADAFKIVQTLEYQNGGASLHGICVSPDGKHVYVTLAQSEIAVADVSDDGSLHWSKRIKLPSNGNKKDSYPCGLALLPNDRAAVCLSINNSLAIVDLAAGKILKQVDVGVAPFDVVASRDGKTAFVSNWGGRRATEHDTTAKSAGTDVVVDNRGVASTGNVGVVDLIAGKQIDEIQTGLHPSDLLMSDDGVIVFVANANADTVSVIDTASKTVTQTINVRPDAKLAFGSMANAVALSPDAKQLFVANGGNNAVAVVPMTSSSEAAETPSGFVPAGWYPGAVATNASHLFIANIKGLGSRDPKDEGNWSTKSYLGTVTRVPLNADGKQLSRWTEQAKSDALFPQALKAWETSTATNVAPVPVPKRLGEPSVFEHVVYIIKENRTYDQVLGDLAKGNNDPKLCTFGKDVSPNHHALAEEFVTLDNFYCNGVLSADGHAWVTEGLANDYLEKSFGAWTRSYPYPGNDPLAFAPTGFIWDNAMLHGRSFRNYGEMALTDEKPEGKWAEVYEDWKANGGKFKFEQRYAIDTLKRYSCPESPGWNLKVPEQIRADVFLKELTEYEKSGDWPNLITLYLPQDHTLAARPDAPTPAAMVADNDLALGRVVDAISHSKYWATTCIFVVEDDPQNGFDHVDGHRSVAYAISPYTKRKQVISKFYNQTSVLHTMELMLGLPPMNQLDAMAPVMRDVFMSKPDLTPYTVRPNTIPLDTMNPTKTALSGRALEMAVQSEQMPVYAPDLVNEDLLNRIIWHSTRGVGSRYPAKYAGAHGRGLKKLHLKLDGRAVDDDDD